MHSLARRFPSLPSPLPIDFLTGVDITVAQERTKDWPVLILGETHPPRWYYFPLQWAVKTPIALALAQLAGLALLIRAGPRTGPCLFAGLSLIGLIAYFMLAFRAQIGFRFALIAVALACLLAGIGLAWMRHRAVVTVAVLLLAAAEQKPYLGNHLAFTNLVVWPKRHAYRFIGDSSIDYRQNEDHAQAWVDSQHAAQLDPVHVLPGRNVFGITRLYAPEHDWVRRQREPQGHFRFSHVYFDVDLPTFHAFLQSERRQETTAADHAFCPSGSPEPVLPGGELRLAPPSAPGMVTLVCVATPQPIALVLHAQEGFAAFGTPAERRKKWALLAPGQAAWFWAEPGTYAILIAAQKGNFLGRFDGGPRLGARVMSVLLDQGGYLPGFAPPPAASLPR